jgi:hypothetical protein
MVLVHGAWCSLYVMGKTWLMVPFHYESVNGVAKSLHLLPLDTGSGLGPGVESYTLLNHMA